jgi:hypothetical protein
MWPNVPQMRPSSPAVGADQALEDVSVVRVELVEGLEVCGEVCAAL